MGKMRWLQINFATMTMVNYVYTSLQMYTTAWTPYSVRSSNNHHPLGGRSSCFGPISPYLLSPVIRDQVKVQSPQSNG